jgi:hypothetical protein
MTSCYRTNMHPSVVDPNLITQAAAAAAATAAAAAK